jgi:hypothetical protein
VASAGSKDFEVLAEYAILRSNAIGLFAFIGKFVGDREFAEKRMALERELDEAEAHARREMLKEAGKPSAMLMATGAVGDFLGALDDLSEQTVDQKREDTDIIPSQIHDLATATVFIRCRLEVIENGMRAVGKMLRGLDRSLENRQASYRRTEHGILNSNQPTPKNISF